jgi:DNA polymerase-3 subunit beta
MKFKIQKDEITSALNLIIGAIEKKQTMSILGNILIEVSLNSLILTATDMEIQCSINKKCETLEENSITVSGMKLFSICKNFPKGEILFKLKDNFLVISSGKINYKLVTQNPSEFPKIQLNIKEAQFTLNKKDFLNLINSCSFCMALKDVRYYLNGMLLESEENKLNCVSTDGHRLAKSVLFGQIELKENISCILPRKGITELTKILSSTSEQNLEVIINKNQICIEIGSIKYISKLIDGRYPDYKKVIPLMNDKEVLINKDSLKNILSRISVLTNENFHGVRLIFDNNLLEIQTNNPEQEFAKEEIEIIYTDKKIDIGFNVNYLIDALNHIISDIVIIKLKNNKTSCLICEEKESNKQFVIMPMRL